MEVFCINRQGFVDDLVNLSHEERGEALIELYDKLNKAENLVDDLADERDRYSDRMDEFKDMITFIYKELEHAK